MCLLWYSLSGACSVEPDLPDWMHGEHLEQLHFRGVRKRGNVIPPSVQSLLNLHALRPRGTGSAVFLTGEKAPVRMGGGI